MRRLFTILLLSIVIFSSCEKEDKVTPITNDHILYIYLGMDNNLYPYGLANIEGIKKGLESGSIRNGKVVAFCDFKTQPNTTLREYYLDRNNKCVENILVDYKTDLDSSDPEVFSQALSDLRRLTSAKEYTLIVSSHGLGWASADLTKLSAIRYSSSNMQSRDVIGDGSKYMNTEDLANVIPYDFFNTIIFDACLMGNIETLYPFSNKSKYLVASISETYIDGLPYKLIMNHMFDMKSTTEQRMESICKAYLQYYSNNTNAYGGNIALYDCSKVKEIKNVMIEVINRIAPTYWQSAEPIQYYDRHRVKMFYDMEHAVRNVIHTSDPLYLRFSVAMKNMVVCTYSTPTVYDIDINNFCGIAMYVPYKGASITNMAYKNTMWYKDVYGNNQLP